MNRWDALNQKAPHPSLTRVPVEAATKSYNGKHSGRTKLIATHQKQINKHNMPFCHLHIKGSTRLTERKITFSGSYYAEIIFMAKLGINAFLRQIPTFVNIDNLFVAIRGKCIRCLLQTFPAGSEQKFKASSERQPAGQRSVHRHWATRFPHRSLPGTVCLPLGPPRHGDVTFLNCNLFRKSRVLLDAMSQLLSLRKTSWQ